jgi:ribosomal protein S18 acetylase RimI-like enzyme
VINLVLLPTGVAWLEGIRVKPTYRRHGVGTALTNYMLDLARAGGARYVMLMVAEWNEASHGLVRKLGFKPATKCVWRCCGGISCASCSWA